MLAEQGAADAQPGWAATEQPAGSTAAVGASSSEAGSSSGAGGSSSSNRSVFAFHRSNLPARCAAFVKDMLAVQPRDRRVGILTKVGSSDAMCTCDEASVRSSCAYRSALPVAAAAVAMCFKTFQEDWLKEPASAAAAAQQPEQQQSSRSGLRDINAKEPAPEAPDVVRPGRFFSTLRAMQNELEQQAAAAGLEAAAPTLALLTQLDALRQEAMVALDRVQRSRGVEAGAVFDYELDVLEAPHV